MRIRNFQKTRWTTILATAAFAVTSICPLKAFAVESITLPVQVMEEDVVSISIPVTDESETSVFDFILDPQGLLYSTDAARYGGGRVEEDATLLFYNKEGEYDFSKHSDWLTVTNRSTVPVRVTVMAQITDFGDIRLAESDDFGDSTEPEVYLAIEDDKGNIMSLPENGEASIGLEMSAAPENTYVFRFDEENHTYQYGMNMDPDMVDFDTYSFRLIGACNSNAEWQEIFVNPMITVTWYVEPIIPEEQEEVSKEIYVEEKNESTANDVTEEDVLVDETGDETDEDDEEQSNNESEGEIGDGNAGDDDGLDDDEEQSDNGFGDEKDDNNAGDEDDLGDGDEEQTDNESEGEN